jgi:phage shock protein PspC (stress-responsive transcriptional regulator)
MAEIFTENKQGAIIGMKEVEEVIKIMGRPEEFGAEPLEAEAEEPKATSSNRIKTGKRLFRNGEEKIIGGVCSGIASYFGIKDPLWIRLLFIIIVFAGGLAIPAYLLLWLIVPEAVTASEKLAMKGEAATVSNIARTIEDEIIELRNKISDLSKDMKSKKKVVTPPLFLRKAALRKGFLL